MPPSPSSSNSAVSADPAPQAEGLKSLKGPEQTFHQQLEQLIVLGADDVVGDYWKIVIRAYQRRPGATTDEALIQKLSELTQIASIKNIQASPDASAAVESILNCKLPKPDEQFCELLDLIFLELVPNQTRTTRYDNLLYDCTNWRHSINDGPIAAGLPFALTLCQEFPEILNSAAKKLAYQKILEIVPTLTPLRFESGELVDLKIWFPDFSKWEQESGSVGLSSNETPARHARLRYRDWRFEIRPAKQD